MNSLIDSNKLRICIPAFGSGDASVPSRNAPTDRS